MQQTKTLVAYFSCSGVTAKAAEAIARAAAERITGKACAQTEKCGRNARRAGVKIFQVLDFFQNV